MASGPESDASEAPVRATPFTLAKRRRASSPVSSHGLPYKTRNRDRRRPVQNQSRLPQISSSTPKQPLQSSPIQEETLRSQALATVATKYSSGTYQPEDENDEIFVDDELSDVGSEQDLETPLQVSGTGLVVSSRRKHRPLTSAIYTQMSVISYQEVQYYKCNHCSKRWKKSGGTHAPARHLKESHQWDPQSSSVALKRKREENDIASAFTRADEITQAQQEQRQREVMRDLIDKEMLEYLYMKWTILHDIPFSLVEYQDFRSFLEYINPVANELLPRSHNTIKARAISLFNEGKKRIRHILQSALSDIHFTCDLWTSPNHLGLLGITAHFTAEDTTLQTLTLGMREVQGQHSGENLALLIENVVEDFSIGNRTGYFMMDNATTNDRFMRVLAQWFHESGQPYDAEQKRLRCNGHVINLAVQAFLFDNISGDIEYLEDLDERQPVRVPDRDELRKWRKIGPLGKLHNIVVFICETPQRKQRFRNIEPHLLPCRDNKTRWNSWYTMLNWAISRIKPAIITFCSDEEELKDDQLSASDWKSLQAIRDFLQLFYDATKATEGRDATLEYLLPSMEFLAQQFEKALIQYADNAFMLASLDAGYSKFIKYFNRAERHSAYIAAVVLNPRFKWTIFSKWDLADRSQAKEALLELWKTDYRSNTGLPEPLAPLQSDNNNSFHRWLDETVALEDQTQDEMERYLANEAPISIGGISAREWWLSAPQKAQFPLLSRMAVDLLSIPAMSSESERVFSATKKTIHQGRWSLKANTIEALECLKSWFQAGYYTQEDLHEVLRQDAAAERSELDNVELE